MGFNNFPCIDLVAFILVGWKMKLSNPSLGQIGRQIGLLPDRDILRKEFVAWFLSFDIQTSSSVAAE
jgi:hypothetical protein